MKRALIGIVVASCFLAACNGHGGKITLSTTTDSSQINLEHNRITAIKVIYSLSDKKVDSMFVDFAPGFVDYGSGVEAPQNNLDTIKTSIKAYIATYPNLKAENINAFAHGDSVIVTATWSGTFLNAQRTREFRFDDGDIFIFNTQGKIKAHRSVQDKGRFFAELNMEAADR